MRNLSLVWHSARRINQAGTSALASAGTAAVLCVLLLWACGKPAPPEPQVEEANFQELNQPAFSLDLPAWPVLLPLTGTAGQGEYRIGIKQHSVEITWYSTSQGTPADLREMANVFRNNPSQKLIATEAGSGVDQHWFKATHKLGGGSWLETVSIFCRKTNVLALLLVRGPDRSPVEMLSAKVFASFKCRGETPFPDVEAPLPATTLEEVGFVAQDGGYILSNLKRDMSFSIIEGGRDTVSLMLKHPESFVRMNAELVGEQMTYTGRSAVTGLGGTKMNVVEARGETRGVTYLFAGFDCTAPSANFQIIGMAPATVTLPDFRKLLQRIGCPKPVEKRP